MLQNLAFHPLQGIPELRKLGHLAKATKSPLEQRGTAVNAALRTHHTNPQLSSEESHLTSERDRASLSSNQSPTYYSCFSNPPVPSSNHWVCTSPALCFFQVPTQHLLFWPCRSLRVPTFHILLDTEGFGPYRDGLLCVHGVRTARWNSPGCWHPAEVQLNPSSAICHLWPWARYAIVSSVVGWIITVALESCSND